MATLFCARCTAWVAGLCVVAGGLAGFVATGSGYNAEPKRCLQARKHIRSTRGAPLRIIPVGPAAPSILQ